MTETSIHTVSYCEDKSKSNTAPKTIQEAINNSLGPIFHGSNEESALVLVREMRLVPVEELLGRIFDKGIYEFLDEWIEELNDHLDAELQALTSCQSGPILYHQHVRLRQALHEYVKAYPHRYYEPSKHFMIVKTDRKGDYRIVVAFDDEEVSKA